ncbi:MAG: hypothetical protein M1812_004256 [Candelaria pacifica]|nr:MAG: hypothetical protein M1812_004256 [Candelaria pacifica]
MSSLRQFTFLELPGEIRNEIYSLLLSVDDTDPRAGRGDILFRPTIGLRLRPPKVYPAILATNHLIHDEAADFLYGKNIFHCFLTGGMTGPEFPLESLEAFVKCRYFRLISRWAIMLRLRDCRDRKSSLQLPLHFATLCNMIAKNSLSEVRIEFINCSPRADKGGQEQAQYMGETLNRLRVLRNVTKAMVLDFTPVHGPARDGEPDSLLSSEYLDELEEVMQGPPTIIEKNEALNATCQLTPLIEGLQVRDTQSVT